MTQVITFPLAPFLPSFKMTTLYCPASCGQSAAMWCSPASHMARSKVSQYFRERTRKLRYTDDRTNFPCLVYDEEPVCLNVTYF
jgi:hypothetical protein